MKVLIVNDDDRRSGGGGNIAMHRFHLGLRKAGIESKILCGNKTLQDVESVAISPSSRIAQLEYQLRRITARLGLNDIHCLSTFGIRKYEAFLDADIVNFHCLHEGYFNYLALPWLTSSKPAVLTLHDMWPLTGHCGYSYDCERWKTGCGKCPYPDVAPAIQRDNTRLEWKLKKWAYNRSNLAVIAPSKWLAEEAKKSVLNRFSIHHIPYGVDTELYRPRDRDECRAALGIPPGKNVLMFAARSMGKLNDDGFRKGNDLLLKAIQALPESLKAETTLLLLGTRGNGFAETVGIQTIDLGYVGDDHLKAVAYAASDLFVFPTRADNLPLVLLESMASGTPMVSFRVGGVPDLVRPGITGYLASPENAEDLCNGIVQLLHDKPLRQSMSRQCRAVAEKEYRLDFYIQRHLDLFSKLLLSFRRPIGLLEIMRQHEHLFDLLSDSVMTRTMEGRITSWNRGAAAFYGWRQEEAIGRISHELLQTQFPKPLTEIEAELVQNRRWEGKLLHTTRNGDRVVVESQWTLDLHRQSGAVVEINARSTVPSNAMCF